MTWAPASQPQRPLFAAAAGRLLPCAVSLALTVVPLVASQARAQNAIVTENQLAGTDPAVWDIAGYGDASIQGFATDISVNRGETVRFKVKTDAAAYHIDVYRLGYYAGQGAP